MKHQTIFDHARQAFLNAILILSVLIIAALSFSYPPHKCTDSTHQTCDGSCFCDGMECKKISEK